MLVPSALHSPTKESSPATSNTDGSETLVAAGLEPFKMSASRLTRLWKQSLQTPASMLPGQRSWDIPLEGTLHYGSLADIAFSKHHLCRALRSIVLVVRFRSLACATFGQPGSNGWETVLLQSSWVGRRSSTRSDSMPRALSNSC